MEMMPASRLVLQGVYGRGVPNEERIVLMPSVPLSLTTLAIMLGWRTSPTSALPIRDNLFWFGEGEIELGSLVFLYTGSGEYRQTRMPTGEPAYVFHWGRSSTLFANSNIVPLVVEFGAITVGTGPSDRPQFPAFMGANGGLST